MALHRAKMLSNGRVTIPVEIRRTLDLAEGDRLAVEQQGEAFLVRRAMSVAERTAGGLAQYRKDPPPTLAEERAAFEQAVADEVAASLAAEADDWTVSQPTGVALVPKLGNKSPS